MAIPSLALSTPEAGSLAGDCLAYWNLPPELIEDLLDGLGRDGLKIGGRSSSGRYR